MSNKNKSKAAMFPFPIVVVIIYLLMGYIWNLWHPGWLIFLTIPLYYFTVNIIETTKEGNMSRVWKIIPYPIFCVIVYFVLGIFYGLWHPAWLIFLTIPIWNFFVSTQAAKGTETTDETTDES